MRTFWLILVQIIRLGVGGVFIFSGFIKANDPMGFAFKLEEYFEVFGMEWMVPLSLFLAIFMCVLEMALGFTLLLGAYMKLTLWLLFLLILFFGFLTFYSAYFDAVKSCGCFGDAIPLTPWQSFWKDMILLGGLLILVAGRKLVRPLFRGKVQLITVFILTAASTAFPMYTYNSMPVINYRDYKIGVNIYKAMFPQMKFYYTLKDKKTGEQKEFETWPAMWDSLYDYVSSRSVPLDSTLTQIIGFSIADSSENDLTAQFLSAAGPLFIFVSYDLDKANIEGFTDMNDFATLCAKDSVPFIVLTATGKEKAEKFKSDHKLKMEFFYNMDDVPLKTAIRSNPGLMMLKDGVLTALWHHNRLPTYTEVKEQMK